MTHTITNFSGFEIQSTDEFLASSGGAVETSITKSSAAARRFDVSAATGFARFTSTLSAAGAFDSGVGVFVWYSYQIYITALPTGGDFYYLDKNTGTGDALLGSLRVGSDGVCDILYQGAAEDVGNSPLVTGKWYTISRKGRGTPNSRVVIVETVTGDAIGSVNHTAGSAGSVANIYLGPYAASEGNVVFDNFVCEGDAAEANIDDPVGLLTSNYTIKVMQANGDGNYNDAEWSGSFADVDELPPDGDTSFRACTFNGDKNFTQTMDDSPSMSSIDALRGYMIANVNANAGTALRFRSGTTDVDLSPVTDSAYMIRQYVNVVDPDTAAAWTKSGVSDIEVGAHRSTGGVEARVTAVYAEVLGTPSVGGSQAIMMFNKIQDFYDELKRILIPTWDLQRRYNEVFI